MIEAVKSPVFSIICTLQKKYECYFNELTDSIEKQTFCDFECIFINDEKENQWIVVPDKRFKVIILENEYGLGQKRNIGISEATGKYVIFCDADDFLPKTLLQTFYDISNRFNADFIVTKTTRKESDLIDNNHVIKRDNYFCDKSQIDDIFFGRYLYDRYYKFGFIFDGCWGRAFRRSILLDNSIRFLEEPCRAEDALFENDYVQHIESLYLTFDYYGYFWRTNQGSEMFNINSFFYNINPFLKKLFEQLSNCDPKYSEKIKDYALDLIFKQFYKFYDAYKGKKITKRKFVEKLDEMLEKDSECLRLISEKNPNATKTEKVVRFLLKRRFYIGALHIDTVFSKNSERFRLIKEKYLDETKTGKMVRFLLKKRLKILALCVDTIYSKYLIRRMNKRF